MNEVMKTILHRRAIRRFDQRQIPEDVLEQILQAGLYAPSAGGRQGVTLCVCQDREINERLGKIKRANSRPHMATATSYVSKEQPSIADDPKLTNAFYDAPTVITLFGTKRISICAGGLCRCGGKYDAGCGCSWGRLMLYRTGMDGILLTRMGRKF